MGLQTFRRKGTHRTMPAMTFHTFCLINLSRCQLGTLERLSSIHISLSCGIHGTRRPSAGSKLTTGSSLGPIALSQNSNQQSMDMQTLISNHLIQHGRLWKGDLRFYVTFVEGLQ